MQSRSFSDPADIAPTLALLTALHANGAETGLPEISRLRTLLLTRLWQPERDARLWLDDAGGPIGFAGIFTPVKDGAYLPLTILARPDLREAVHEAALRWAEECAAGRAQALGQAVLLCITGALDNPREQSWPITAGFVRHEQWDVVHLARPLENLPEISPLPEGYQLQPLPAIADLDRFTAAYAPIFARRGLAQRRRVMAHPEYEPTLEFLALAADRSVAAICEASISRASWASLDRRTGTIDWLASHPELRRRGLGRVLLTIALHRLRDASADTARLFTERTNLAARQLYDQLGFVEDGAGLCYARRIGPR